MLEKPKFGMIRDVKVSQNDNSDYYVKLEYNGMTPIYYMNLIGRGLMEDMVESLSNEESIGLYKSMTKEEIEHPETIPLDKKIKLMKVLNKSKYIDFMRNFIAVLFYTAHSEYKLSLESIFADYLPDDLMENDAIVEAATEILNVKVTNKLKKNVNTLKREMN